jgi:NAD+ synthase (glutamine-hydrolysing)
MKITLAQLNYHIGNFRNNSDKLINAINLAQKEGSELIVFSELSVTGYTPHDLLEQKDFVEEAIETAKIIAKHCTNIAAIIGCPTINENPEGKKLFNSAMFLKNGKIEKTINKTLLPTYDIFDEYRYFEPNDIFELIELNGEKIALTICEDLWDEQEIQINFSRQKLYKKTPMDELIKLKPKLIINIAGSPFSYNQKDMRKNILKRNAKKYNLPLVYVNQTGAQTELIFDGGSMFLNSNGNIVKELKYFEEDIAHINTNDYKAKESYNIEKNNRLEGIYNALVLGVRDYFYKNGFKKACLGLSGGIDSALTLAIAAEALGSENIDVLLMPSQFSSKHSVDDAVRLAENLNIKHHIIPINNLYHGFNQSLSGIFVNKQSDVTEENIQARIRGMLLMAYSNKFGHIVLNTSNKSEAAVGYTTLYGDMNGGLSVLGDVYKTDVYLLSKYINRDKEIIPVNTITKPPSAELRPEQKDSDSLPEYDILDNLLFQYIEQKKSVSEINVNGLDNKQITEIIKMVNQNEYKRFQAPPILRISSKAFGFGRRIPLVAKF